MQAQTPNPLQLAPKLKSGPLPSKQLFSLTAEAGMPAGMISAYLPQREQLAEQYKEHGIPASALWSPHDQMVT